MGHSAAGQSVRYAIQRMQAQGERLFGISMPYRITISEYNGVDLFCCLANCYKFIIHSSLLVCLFISFQEATDRIQLRLMHIHERYYSRQQWMLPKDDNSIALLRCCWLPALLQLPLCVVIYRASVSPRLNVQDMLCSYSLWSIQSITD